MLAQHYGPGESYNAFVAKDISRAFVTGEFDAKSSKDSLDHVLALSPSELVGLKKWRDFYAENYNFVGRLIGRWVIQSKAVIILEKSYFSFSGFTPHIFTSQLTFRNNFFSIGFIYMARWMMAFCLSFLSSFYEETGEPTEYFWQIDRKIQFGEFPLSALDSSLWKGKKVFKRNLRRKRLRQCWWWSIVDFETFLGIKQQEEEQSFKHEFPPCNVEYKPESGSRFWCTDVRVNNIRRGHEWTFLLLLAAIRWHQAWLGGLSDPAIRPRLEDILLRVRPKGEHRTTSTETVWQLRRAIAILLRSKWRATQQWWRLDLRRKLKSTIA